MLEIYDLYDLSAVFTNIRVRPEYELNKEVLQTIISVLKNIKKTGVGTTNKVRIALASIPAIDKEMYGFAFVENFYTYLPSFVKNEVVYSVLIDSCACLLRAVEGKNIEKIRDLADCLHNLPVFIADSNHYYGNGYQYSIPESFWENEVECFRKKWDRGFLKKVQKKSKRAVDVQTVG